MSGSKVSRTTEYCQQLALLADWIPFLKSHSGLPGPRANLELAHAVAQTGERDLFETLLGFELAQPNTPDEFLFFCGVLGLEKLLAGGDLTQAKRLRVYASNSSWRIREAAAIALQMVADKDRDLWLNTALEWSRGTWLEKRAAAAALAEPRLLKDPQAAEFALNVIQSITVSIADTEDRTDADYKVLCKAMSYCWSVVVATLPGPGKALMQPWFSSRYSVILQIMLANLTKDRLLKTDLEWALKHIDDLKTAGN